MKKQLIFIFILFAVYQTAFSQHSIARQWNEILLESIRNDFARPTVHARNLFHVSAAMYDAWAIYDDEARPFFMGNTVGNYTFILDDFQSTKPVGESQIEAISYACYRLLRYRFSGSPGASMLLQMYNAKMAELGFDTNYTSTNYKSGNPAALGNYIAQQIIQFGRQDGSNELINYTNQYYKPVNPPLVIKGVGNPDIKNLNRWQPIAFDVFIDQSGNEIPGNIPSFLSPEWGNVVPFSLNPSELTVYNRDGNDYKVYDDPGMPPQLLPGSQAGLDDEYRWNFSLVAIWSSQLDANDTTMWDISPATIGNIQSYPNNFEEYKEFYDLYGGGDPLTGYTINPKTGLPYQPQIVKRGDYGRVLAEFWADGPDSETPPGHWFTILNYVNDQPELIKKFGGKGELIDDLEWDVKSYLLLGGTMHDVAIVAWGVKGYYDYIRPVSAIRGMAEKGQSSDPNLPNYSEDGLPLIPGYFELINEGDSLAGENNEYVNEIKMKGWLGPTKIGNPLIDQAHVGWLRALDWWPYQRPTFVTPPFAGYVSGHSTYSRAAAEILTALTGDPYFPRGMGEFQAPKNEFLVFEEGPSTDIVLQWAKYYDASDQCSLSRIWGGIHPPADDIPGRKLGIKIGTEAFQFTLPYFYADQDGDGYYSYEDCDDNNPNIHPNAPEICNNQDENCNGMIDEGLQLFAYYYDEDGDGFGDAYQEIEICLDFAPNNYVDNNLDCDDSNPNINPNAVEICDGIDNDCNGFIDDGLPLYTYYLDLDGDGYGDINMALDTCVGSAPANYVTNSIDCDDNNGMINPSMVEICDGIDNDCNGLIDDNLPLHTYYLDVDGDGYGDAQFSLEICDMSPPFGYVLSATDCNDDDGSIHPNATEICDGIDNDCNGLIDDTETIYTYYRDEDNDGYGNSYILIDTCISQAPFGYSSNDLDCNDLEMGIHPNADEIADNGIDEDCDGIDFYAEFKIFPTYAMDELNIHYNIGSQSTSVFIFNNLGQQVINQNASFYQNDEIIDITDLSAGIYYLIISNEAKNTLASGTFVKINKSF
ncbi:MAG TPA: MopE-related protein [Saprospiraceae bacterium]|nr:MopE-related protein [Saprospiraceae bacterium]